MNYTKDKLLGVARHWEGLSLNDRLANKEPTPMITIEIPVVVWNKIWEDDAAPDMYEVLKKISVVLANPLTTRSEPTPELRVARARDEAWIMSREALAKAEGREE